LGDNERVKRYIVTMTRWMPDLGQHPGPRYRAIADAIAADLARGRLRPGTRLPTHRDLADSLGVTVGTVTRGYAEAARRGLLSGEVGRGTFLRGAPLDPLAFPGGAVARGVLDLSVNHPPSLGADHGSALADTLAALARRGGLESLLGYPPDGGSAEHREAGARWVARARVGASADQVLVSNGSQHGMTAVLAALLRPGDLVVTEALTYPGMKALATLLHLRIQGLPIDAEGLRADAFEDACRSGAVRALYVVPTLHNPTSAIMGDARRREIARIAQAHGVTIVEDDVHGVLPETAPAPIFTHAPEITCYLTGLAKSVAPGLRIGYVVAPPALVTRLAAGIRATTWMAAPLMAEIASRWVMDGTAARLLDAKRAEATARQEIAARVLAHFRLDTHPQAYHLWLHLPDPWRSETFADEARRLGVAVTPAQAFLVGRGTAPHAVRVCLGPAPDRQTLEDGLRVLALLLEGPAEAGLLVV
jgi:DNA-binding transcriptional MocR family regulator